MFIIDGLFKYQDGMKRIYLKERGLTLIEVAIYVILIAFIFLAINEVMAVRAQNSEEKRIAKVVLTYSDALVSYVQNTSSLATTLEENKPQEVTPEFLQDNGFLSQTFNPVLPNGQHLKGFIRKRSSVKSYNGTNFSHISSVILSTGGDSFEQDILGHIERLLGEQGGIIDSFDDRVIVKGVHQNWQFQSDDWSELSSFIQKGHLIAFQVDLQALPYHDFIAGDPVINPINESSDIALISNTQQQESGLLHEWAPLYTSDRIEISLTSHNVYTKKVEVLIDNHVVDSFFENTDKVIIYPQKEWLSGFHTIQIRITPYDQNGRHGDSVSTETYRIHHYFDDIWDSFVLKMGPNLYQHDYSVPSQPLVSPTETVTGFCADDIVPPPGPADNTAPPESENVNVGFDITGLKVHNIIQPPDGADYLYPIELTLCAGSSDDSCDYRQTIQILHPLPDMETNWETFGRRYQKNPQIPFIKFDQPLFTTILSNCHKSDKGEWYVHINDYKGDSHSDNGHFHWDGNDQKSWTPNRSIVVQGSE